MSAYYNENNMDAAAWLRELIARDIIAAGDVDSRSIADVKPEDLSGYDQCHFFAGIGGWSYALRLAGWPDSRPVWTGSCPCQPFSVAGKDEGTADKRHLWPEFRRLIAERGPTTVFGEQVASKAGRGWLAGVRADLEALGYGVGGADLCAASAGAPHIRQRLWWAANADGAGRSEQRRASTIQAEQYAAERGGSSGRLADAGHEPEGRGAVPREAEGGRAFSDATGRRPRRGGDGESNPWAECIWLPCGDGKSRRIKPGLEPLAHGVPARLGRLRGYGNAIVPQVAAEFITCAVEAL